MNCSNPSCTQNTIIQLQHGSLCKNHFLAYFEERVFKTINKFGLIDRNDRICVATSGGKDSLTVLYLTKKYLGKYQMNCPLFALAVDEGIHDYREKTLEDLRKFCDEHNVTLHLIRAEEEFGKPLDTAYPIINKDAGKKPCNVCGVWRRQLLNKHARKLGATKVVTGHNLDDEAQAIVMNIFKANTSLAARLGPKSGVQAHELFIQRVKPLYLCPEKEVRLYAYLKGFKIQFAECPYAQDGYRFQIQEMLNEFEQKYKGTKQGIINSFLEILPQLKEKEMQNVSEIHSCERCQEPATQNVCNACKIQEVLQYG